MDKEDRLAKKSEHGMEIYPWVHTTKKDIKAPATLATNWKPRLEMDGVKSGEAETKYGLHRDLPRNGAHTT